MDNLQKEMSVKDYVLQDERLLWTGKPVKPVKLLPNEKLIEQCSINS